MAAANATDVTLDRLQQQVEGGGCPISAACARLENMVEGLCKDVITRPLLNALARILSLLLGDEHKVGWIENALDEESIRALSRLLRPTGCIFHATLSYSALDDTSHFELPITSLPVPLQKQLQRQGVKGLPVPFDTCVYNVARDGTPRYLLRLNPSEYFIFRLLTILPAINRHNPHSLSFATNGGGLRRSSSGFFQSRSHSLDSVGLKIVGGVEKSFRFRNDHAARLYQQLISDYLYYFLPVARHGGKPSVDSAFSTKSLKSSIGMWCGWKLASFFTTSINEIWLHQCDYQISPTGVIEGEPMFSLPSIDEFETLKVVTKHLVTAVSCPIRPDLAPQLQSFYEQLVDASFVTFRVYLYRLLRLSLAKCPSDSSIALVSSLWLEFVAPWTFLDLSGAASTDHPDYGANIAVWEQYVVNNYFFYHTLLGSFLDYVQVMAEGFGEALARSGSENLDLETTTSTLMPLLLFLAKVVATISPFADLIGQIENEELSHGGTQGWQRTASFIRRAQAQRGVREQLCALESERFVLNPLFDSASKLRTLSILYWLEKIYGSLPEEAPSASASSTQVGSLHLMERQKSQTLPRSNFPIHATIIQCEEELCSLFSIHEEGFTEFSERFEMTRAQTRLIDTGEASGGRRRMIPAALPNKRVELKLSHREQKHANVPAPVKSYESVLLVQLTASLSELLNRLFNNLLLYAEDRGASLPLGVKSLRFNMRFLAAYPNIVFLTGCLLVLYLVGKILF